MSADLTPEQLVDLTQKAEAARNAQAAWRATVEAIFPGGEWIGGRWIHCNGTDFYQSPDQYRRRPDPTPTKLALRGGGNYRTMDGRMRELLERLHTFMEEMFCVGWNDDSDIQSSTFTSLSDEIHTLLKETT